MVYTNMTMTDSLIIVAHVPTPAIRDGFLPAAERLGLKTTLLTDVPEQYPGEPVIGCDVFNPIAIVETIHNRGLACDGLFSNSDHLQTPTALAAQLLGLPHKSPKACYLAKHKTEMRRELQRLGLETVRHLQFASLAEVQSRPDIPFPCVAKPCKGVASMRVRYCADRPELEAFAATFWDEKHRVPMLVEEYLPGTICSLETLGELVLGGFTCTLSPLPHFIETEARWGFPPGGAEYVMKALRALGCTFGACHTEFVMAPDGPRIIEVNYRSIGDQSDFMLDNLMGGTYFESVLRVHLGRPPATRSVPSESHSAAHYLYARQAGVLEHVPGGFVRREAHFAIHFEPARKSADVVELSHSNKDYLGLLHVTGPGRETVEARLRDEVRRVEEAIRWR